MRDVFLPMWLIRFSFLHPEIYRVGYFAALCGLSLIIYKIRTSRTDNAFKKGLLYVMYAGAFRAGLLTVLYHPYYTGMLASLLEFPQLVAVIYLAITMIRRYGIGGNIEHNEH